MSSLQVYSIFHLNIAYSSIEEEQRPEVIRHCYWPLLQLAQKYNLPFGIEASGYTLESIAKLDPDWIKELYLLITEGPCEFIGSGYTQIIGPLVPAQVNSANLRLGNEVYQRLLGYKPQIALVNEQAYSAGLIQHYLDAGYEAIVMEWDNPAQQHPEWDLEWRYLPQIALGQNGERIPVIWNKSIAFQKFQRYVHGEMELDEYVDYLINHLADQPRAFSIYGNDIEIFDFRPNRYETEASQSGVSEWSRIETLFIALKADDHFQFIRPSKVLNLISETGAGNALRLETANQPIPVKKQEKYNIIRWAVTGRNDFNINTACWKIFAALNTQKLTDDNEWRELCYLWSSDFRTHITDKRWAAYYERLLNNRNLQVSGNCQKSESSEKRSGILSSADFKISRSGRYMIVENDWLILRLNCRRGLALDAFINKRLGDVPLCGTLHHGYYDDIKWSADYYTGHLIFDTPGYPKVTDLNPVDPKVSRMDDYLRIEAEIQTKLGAITKDWIIEFEPEQLSFSYSLNWQTPVIGAFRIGHITLIPDSFELKSLFYQTHNGGNGLETFEVGNANVDHSHSVSFLVSASHAIGVTEGIVVLGDAHRRLTIRIDKTSGALVGLITHQRMRNNYFYRLVFTSREVDDTSYPSPIGELKCRICLDTMAGTNLK